MDLAKYSINSTAGVHMDIITLYIEAGASNTEFEIIENQHHGTD